MALRNRIQDEEISRLLLELNDDELEDSASENEDDIIEDNVQSDIEDEEIRLLSPFIILETSQTHLEDLSSEPLDSSHTSSDTIVSSPHIQLKGKNNHQWTVNKGKPGGRASASTKLRMSRIPSRMNRFLYDPLSCFNIFVTDEIIDEITKWTNEEIKKKFQGPNLKATFRGTNFTEIRALIGILVLSAAMKDNHLSTEELFDCSYSGTRYLTAMSKNRFDVLIRCLRMDDKTLRPKLATADIFIPIRKIWEIFVSHCRANYIPGPFVAINDQVLGFQGRCPFRISIPDKPNKYGIKIIMTCDSATSYMLDAMPYLGRRTETNTLPISEYYVKEVTKTIHGSNRNVTCDNWFTSVPLAKSLLEAPYNLTLVGAIRSNKLEIPEELKNLCSRPVGSSMFCYDGPLTLVSYKPKPSKIVYVLSTYEEDSTVNPDTSSMPKIVRMYNETKGGIDTFNQMCSMMSCSRKTNRWPLAIFYGILNMAFVNAYVIYCHNVTTKQEKPRSRRDFMKELSNNLITPWMSMRQETPTLPKNLKDKISEILPKRPPVPLFHEDDVSLPKKRKYCTFCPAKIRRMTKSICDKCNTHICGEHKHNICYKCFQNNV